MSSKKIANFLNRNLSSRIGIKWSFVARPKTCESHFNKVSKSTNRPETNRLELTKDFQNLFCLDPVQNFEIPGRRVLVRGSLAKPLKSLLNWVPNRQSFVKHFYSSHLILMDRSFLLTILFDVFPADCSTEHIHTSNHLKNDWVQCLIRSVLIGLRRLFVQSAQEVVHLSSFEKWLRTVHPY